MTLQTEVQAAAVDFTAAAAALTADAALLHSLMTGPASGAGSTVSVGSSNDPLPTLAKIVADYAAGGIADNAVTTVKILNLAVSTGKIADLAVTTGKLNDLAVTTAKLIDAAVTLAKMANLTHGKFIGRLAATDGVPEAATIAFGQCRLSKSAANLLLLPLRGNLLTINSKAETIPDAGVSLAPTGLIPTVTTRARASNVATLGTAAAHELVVGEMTRVSLVGGTGYNTSIPVAVTAVPTSQSFSYASTGSNEGTTADTAGRVECDRYIYAFMNSTTMTLEARGRSIVHAAQAGTGVEIATADATRTLVGLARVIPGPAWADTATQRFVRSWFNDPGIEFSNALGGIRTLNSSTPTFAEIHGEIRCEFLTWGSPEIVHVSANGSLSNGAGSNSRTAFAFDAGTAEDSIVASTGHTSSTGGVLSPLSLDFFKAGLSEGYHVVTLYGSSDAAATTYWLGSGSSGQRTTLRGRVRP